MLKVTAVICGSHLDVASWNSGSQLACQAPGALPYIDTIHRGQSQGGTKQQGVDMGQGHLAQAVCTALLLGASPQRDFPQ